MKHIKLIFGLCLLLSQAINAQDKHIAFKTKIFESNALKAKGYLYALDDSTLFLSRVKFDNAFIHVPDTSLQKFHYYDLQEVQLHRKNRVGRGIMIGAITGLVIGGVGGFASGDDPPGWMSMTAGEKAAAYGVTGALVGTIVGAIAGAVSTKVFKIGGNKENFHGMKSSLGKKVIQW